MGDRFKHIKRQDFYGIISSLMVMIPCLLSSIYSGIVYNGSMNLAYWIITVLIAILAVQQNGKLLITRRQTNWMIVWVGLFLITLLNNNGDLENNTQSPVINWLVIVLFTTVIVMHKNFDDSHILNAIKILLGIQLIAGFYFFLFPNQLMSLSGFFRLSGNALRKFYNCISAGYFMGFATHYSTSGIYMNLGTILSAACLLADKARNRTFNKVKIVVFVFFLVALILTGKRAHLLFGGVAILIMYFVGYVKGNLNKRLVQVFSFIFIFVVAIFIAMRIPAFSTTIARFMTESTDLNDLSSNRVDSLWIPAWEAFKENPLFGIGWRQFKYQFPQTQSIYVIHNDVHNVYLQLLCETGVVGFILFISTMVYTYILTWKLLVCQKRETESACYLQIMFSLGYQTFFLLYCFTGNPLYDIQCLFPYLISCAFTYKYYRVRHGKQEKIL